MSDGLLDRFRESDFEDWLREGLERTLWEGAGAWAFPGADAEIRRADYLADGLRNAYLTLASEQQGRFRRAVANLMASLDPLERNVPLFEYLLSLAALVPAPEILRVLPARIGGGFFGQVGKASPEGARNLFGLSMLTVARLSAPRQEAVACLHALIGSPNFDVAYSGLALEALVRADGQGLVAHLILLRDSLDAMFREFQTDAGHRRAIATAVLNAAQLPAVLRAWGEIKYFDRVDESAALDAWFPSALLSGDDSPLVCERDGEGNLFVFRRERRTVREPVPQDGPNFLGLLDLLNAQDLMGSRGISYDSTHARPRPGRRRRVQLSREELGLAGSFCIPPNLLAQYPAASPSAGPRAP